jgi:hypothetical protein
MTTIERTLTGKQWTQALIENANETDDLTVRTMNIVSNELTAVTQYHVERDSRYAILGRATASMTESAMNHMLNQKITIAIPTC